ncbi:MAG: two-component regulator propeller domain-containing protein, partial [Bacteroidota bacterium]
STVLLLGLALCAGAQQAIRFDHISTKDGLSQSDINTIYQDAQGYMWFGTHDGLNRYDGYEFTVYKPDPKKPGSINSNLIFSISGDDRGNLWIGTTGSGLNYFDRQTETFTSYTEADGLAHNHVTTVFLDSQQRLWIGTNDGLNLLDLRLPEEQRTFQLFHPEKAPFMVGWDGKSVMAIYEDSEQQIWIGGHGGLYKLSRDEAGQLYVATMNEHVGLPLTNVRSIVEGPNGNLLLGTDQGLFAQSRGLQMKLIADGAINRLELVQGRDLWVGTSEGLIHYQFAPGDELPAFRGEFVYDPLDPYSLSKDVIRSIYVDKTGILWIGTNGGGINTYDRDRKQFLHVKKSPNPGSLSYDKIRSMFEDSDGTVWIGTEGGGLNRLSPTDDGRYNSFEHFPSVRNPFAIAEIVTRRRRTLLIGVEDNVGLYELELTGGRVRDSDFKVVTGIAASVFTILQDSRGNIWIGTYGKGIQRLIYQEETDDFERSAVVHDPNDPNSLPSNIIRNIFEDRHGNIWIGTGDGLCRVTTEESTRHQPRFDRFQTNPAHAAPISHNYILPIYESQSGVLWVGTLGGGLNRFLPGTEGSAEGFRSYGESDGLPNNVIKAILEDENGHLWLSTNVGLSRFDPVNEVFTNFDVNDGLQDNEFQELASLRLRDGEMLFGGVNGFNAFYPREIRSNPFEPETVITEFSLSNEPVPIGAEVNGRVILQAPVNEVEALSVKYAENNLSFEFAALHFAAPRKNQFAYMLEGFDKDWIYTNADKRFATYTNIQPGQYTLKVRASNNDGLWDSTPASLELIVIPPWWRTNTAYGIYAVIAILMLVAFRRYTIIRTTEKHQLELEHIEKENMEELQRVKLDFFTNISHEFRTPLTLIKGPLDYLQANRQKLDEAEASEQFGLIQKNANYLLRLVNQLLDFRKLDQGKMKLFIRNADIIECIKEVSDPFQFLAQKKQINYQVVSDFDTLSSWFDPDAIEKILNNLLSNAFKFTPEGGKVEVAIRDGSKHGLCEAGGKVQCDCLLIEVSDSGPGIARNKIGEIFQRFYTEASRVNQNSGGMGIGLAFTKSLVELHQGRIDVRSQPKKGATFSIVMPRRKEAYLDIQELNCVDDPATGVYVNTPTADAQAIAINDELEDQNLSKSRSKLPILLVVDDNPDIRTFLKRCLHDTYAIYEAENGEQGLEIAHQIMPKIILTDILMPVMDGIQFCEAIKTDEKTSHIPVLMLTARSSQESEFESLLTGADDYLRKPFEMELLKLKLANIISQRDELRRRFTRNIALKPAEITVTSADEKFLQQAIETVEKHMMDTQFSVEMLVKEMGLSRSNLYLKFKEITGLSSSEFIRNIRLKRAVQLLEQSDYTVKEIMYKTGFNTASYFAKCFKKQYGMIPSEYVRKPREKQEI